jgi:hypothetical protein
VLFVGVDWAEAHHDLCVLAEDGRVLARGRISDDLAGVGRLHQLVGEHAEMAGQVVVGIETDRGLLAGALVTAGYQVYAVNPLAVSRYRDRHSLSGAKSDAADAKVLADLVRTDRHNHRPVADDSHLAEAIKILARSHQSLIWSRQAQVNSLRSGLRECYPGALAAFGPTWPTGTRWRCCGWRRPRPVGVGCRCRGWSACCAGPAASAASRRGPSSCGRRCRRRGWRHRSRSWRPGRRWWPPRWR